VSGAAHVVDDQVPLARQLEVAGSFGDEVGHGHLDDPVDAERPLPLLGAGDEIPDVTLGDQTPGVDDAPCLLVGAVLVVQRDL